MIRTVITGLWACIITVVSVYAAAYWKADAAPAEKEEPYLEGLEFRKLEPITVPMIADGNVAGYVLARLVYTADAATLREFAMDPGPFVTDEAFREIYLNGKVTFGKISKYDIDALVGAIRENVNTRIGAGFIQDVLVEEINYVDKTSLAARNDSNTQSK